MITETKSLSRQEQKERKENIFKYYNSIKDKLKEKGLGKMEIYQHIADMYGYRERNSIATIINKKLKEGNK